MLTAARLAWQACGSPPDTKATGTGVCLVCGAGQVPVMPASSGIGKSFDLVAAARLDSRSVCEPCAWALAGKPPNTLRMWSIAVTGSTPLPVTHPDSPPGFTGDGRLHLANRRDLSTLIDVLTSPPDDVWAVSVAVSGQKHLLPYTPVNHGPGPFRVRVETAEVATDPLEVAALIGACARLRAAGHSTGSIHACAPSVAALTATGLPAWREWAPLIAPHANSPLLGLALHLTTKETVHALADRFAAP